MVAPAYGLARAAQKYARANRLLLVTLTGMREATEELRARLVRQLEASVVSTHRVRAYSLGGDLERLMAIRVGTITLMVAGDEQTMELALPSEEQMESLAARVRPVILEREDTFHSNALEPIGCLGVGRPPPRPVEVLKSLREAWKRADDKRVDVRGYLKQVRRPDGSSAEASDSVLAWDGSTETWFTRMSSGLLSRTGSTCATGTGRRAWLSPTLRI